jgi:hypothetical protein
MSDLTVWIRGLYPLGPFSTVVDLQVVLHLHTTTVQCTHTLSLSLSLSYSKFSTLSSYYISVMTRGLGVKTLDTLALLE